MALNPELLEILACPQCKQAIEPNADQTWLICRACGVRYPVREEIPIMLVEEAQPLEASAE